MPRPSTTKTTSQIRLDNSLFAKLRIVAAKESRSMNSQLEYFVKQSIDRYEAEHGEIILPDPSSES